MKNRKVIITIIIIILSVVLLECTFFNLKHWTTRIGLPYIDTEQTFITRSENELIISDINQKIRTIYLKPYTEDIRLKMFDISISYRDENQLFTQDQSIIIGYEPSYHISLGAMGIVDSISVQVHNEGVVIQEISFNTPLPWVFMMPRVLLLSVVLIISFVWKNYMLSNIMFKLESKKQKFVSISILALFIVMLFFAMVFSTDIGWNPGADNSLHWNPSRSGQNGLNDLMTDSILEGKTYLGVGVDESLINATRPYNITYREENNVVSRWDHVYFEGKYYSYFGIIPVLLLHIPFLLTTGRYVSVAGATFIYSVMASIGIYLLWKELVRKYIKDIPYTLYLAALISALFGSNIMLLTVKGGIYESAIASAFMFAVWGLFFIFRSVRNLSFDKINYAALFFGCSGLALAVGCRPTYMFYSLLVPVVLFPIIRACFPLKGFLTDKRAVITSLNCLAAVIIPYITIGSGLMWYNYTRFGSVIEFGITYHITIENTAVLTDVGALGVIQRIIDGFFSFFFTSFTIKPEFPFIFTNNALGFFQGRYTRYCLIGLLAFPVTWFSAYIYKMRRDKLFPVILSFIAVGLIIIGFTGGLVGVLGRHTVDFYFLFFISSLLCIGSLNTKAMELGSVVISAVRKFSFVAIAASCIIFFAWAITGPNIPPDIWNFNPIIMRYLHDMFVIA